VNYFTINRQLPSLNEYIKELNRNRHKGNKFKQEIEEDIGWYIRNAVIKGRLTPVTEQVDLVIIWCEKAMKRDTDNIQSATKFILDAMRAGSIIKNDSRKYVRQIYHHIEDGAKEDSVAVYLYKARTLKVSFTITEESEA
jgi:Holliday junction resolvase RusA-like endonuclease